MKRIILACFLAILLSFFAFYFSSYTFPYKGFFPYKNVALEYSKSFLAKLANFDGVHYLKIAKNGYDQYEQAFFPLYPVLIRLLSPIFFGNLLYSAIFLSNASLVLGAALFYKVLQKHFGGEQASWALLFFLFFPTAFYLSSVYTEALFFLLFFAGFYFLEKGRLKESFLFFYLLGLTRVVGVLAAPAIILYDKGRKKSFYLAAAPILGLLTYMIYLYKTTGDPLFFFTSQPAFGANRSTTFVLLPQVYFRYLKIFFSVPPSFPLFVAFLEVLFFSVVFLALSLYLFGIIKKRVFTGAESAFLLFSLAAILMPTLTGTFLSMPRFTLLSFSFLIFLAKIRRKGFKILLLLIFVFLRIVLNFLFAQGYFIS